MCTSHSVYKHLQRTFTNSSLLFLKPWPEGSGSACGRGGTHRAPCPESGGVCARPSSAPSCGKTSALPLQASCSSSETLTEENDRFPRVITVICTVSRFSNVSSDSNLVKIHLSLIAHFHETSGSTHSKQFLKIFALFSKLNVVTIRVK